MSEWKIVATRSKPILDKILEHFGRKIVIWKPGHLFFYNDELSKGENDPLLHEKDRCNGEKIE